jgi:hypothetical protein
MQIIANVKGRTIKAMKKMIATDCSALLMNRSADTNMTHPA